MWHLGRACWNRKCIFRTVENIKLIFPLWLFSDHIQGPFSYKCHTVWFFYLTRDWSKGDVSPIQGLLLWDRFFFLRNQYQLDSDTEQHCLDTAQLLSQFFRNLKIHQYIIPFQEYIKFLIYTLTSPKFHFFLLKRSIKKLHSFFKRTIL